MRSMVKWGSKYSVIRSSVFGRGTQIRDQVNVYCVKVGEDSKIDAYVYIEQGVDQMYVYFASAPVDGVEELFPSTMDFWPLSEATDIVCSLEAFLEDETPRRKIAESGYRRVLSSHTLMHRAKTLYNLMAKH